MKESKVKRPGRGRPKHNPKALAGDKGYSFEKNREYLSSRHIKDVIPAKDNQPKNEAFDKLLYRQRNKAER